MSAGGVFWCQAGSRIIWAIMHLAPQLRSNRSVRFWPQPAESGLCLRCVSSTGGPLTGPRCLISNRDTMFETLRSTLKISYPSNPCTKGVGPMEAAIQYRGLASRFEREAFASTLPRIRELKLSAARRWEALAGEKEMVVRGSGSSDRTDWIF